jgi:hypothetical protein
MEQSALGTDAAKTGQEIVGYLNFSSGAADPRFLKNVNRLFEVTDASPDRVEPTWKALHRSLSKTLQELHSGAPAQRAGEAFREVEQAEAVLGLVFDKTLPGYRQFHSDLLFHQSEESLFQPLFIGRACEAVLHQGGPWDQTERIVRGAIAHQTTTWAIARWPCSARSRRSSPMPTNGCGRSRFTSAVRA